MKITHREDGIRFEINRGRCRHTFWALPQSINYIDKNDEKGAWKTTPDYYNWKVQLSGQISREYGKADIQMRIENKGFRSFNEICEYVKRFEDPDIADSEGVDSFI